MDIWLSCLCLHICVVEFLLSPLTCMAQAFTFKGQDVPAPAIYAPVRRHLAGVVRWALCMGAPASTPYFPSFYSRLIMSTHRELEAFKRRKAKPLPYLTKGLGSLARGDQGWRDL